MPLPELKFADTNLAGIGSELDANLRKSAGGAEAEFEGAGEAPGLEIWRIEKFQVKKIPESEHGVFYSGDAYIVLNTYLGDDSDTLFYDVHFFLGKDCTQDERGAAAYMTVSLDDKLGGRPVQFREVQHHESAKFSSYFPRMTTLDGGIDSGFKAVEPESYMPRLICVYGPGDALKVRQVPMEVASLNKSDVFILDTGLNLYQWNAPNANAFERMRASQVREQIQSDRDGQPKEHVIDGDDIDAESQWWEHLGGGSSADVPDDATKYGDRSAVAASDADPVCKIYSISDETGDMVATLVEEGESGTTSALSEDDISAVVATRGASVHVFLVAGNTASPEEKFYMSFCTDKILESLELSPITAVSIVKPGVVDTAFDALFE